MNAYQKKAERLLKDYNKLTNQIKGKYREIEYYQGKVTGGAIRYDKDRVQSSPTNMLETMLCEANVVQQELDRLIERYNEINKQLKRYVRKLSDEDCKLIIKMHYFFYEPWKIIPDKMQMSQRTMWRKYDKALNEIGKMLVKDEEETRKQLIENVKGR